jgi:hypothetical protein
MRGAAPGEGLPSLSRQPGARPDDLHNLIHVFTTIDFETLPHGRRANLGPRSWLRTGPDSGFDVVGRFVGRRLPRAALPGRGESHLHARQSHDKVLGGEVQLIDRHRSAVQFGLQFLPATFFLPPPNDGTPVAFLFLELAFAFRRSDSKP